MEWIRRNRLRLGGVLAASAIVSVLELLWVRSTTDVLVEPWQLGLIMLPWFTTAGSLLSLCYLLWFGSATDGLLTTVGKALFWAIAAVFGALFGVIYGSFVFGLF